MSTSMRHVAAAFVLATLGTACTAGDNQPATSKPSQTNTVRPSPAVTESAQLGILRIRRKLPEGPLFTEGSAAYARVTDSSETVVFDGYFDVPRVPEASNKFPRRLRVELPPGRYHLAIAQRPCNASACSQQGPEGWGEETLRCKVRFRLSAEQIFTTTAVVRSEGCRIVQQSHAGQLGD